MPLVANDLKDAVKTEMLTLTLSELSNTLIIHGKVATAVQNYLFSNLDITGSYVGTIPGPAPDPLNGVFIWSPSSLVLTSATMVAAAAGSGFDSWVVDIETQLRLTSIVGSDQTSVITTSVPGLLTNLSLASILDKNTIKLIHLGLTPQQIRDADLFDLAWDHIANKIVDAHVATLPVPVSSAAVSTSPGSAGTVTWTIIS